MKIIKKDKNKLKLKAKSKILVLGLILIVLVGLFSPVEKANAENGTCIALEDSINIGSLPVATSGGCTLDFVKTSFPNADNAIWVPPGGKDLTQKPETAAVKSAFENEIDKNSCGFGKLTGGGTFFPGCFIQASYGLFYVLPAIILWAAAYFFNVLISITLTSDLLAGSSFIPGAWGVVRDLSNIFFILILLYIAIKLILDLGGHDVKKMIAKVVVIALLINFSMFFTQVVIDASNILALVFYNKLDVKTIANGKPITYLPVVGESDVSGAMWHSFDPTKILTQEFFDKTKVVTAYGQTFANSGTPVGPGILIGISIISGLIMFFAAYCFFIAGLSFVGRLIELWVLIIFSPFAFMSSTVPKLAGVEYLGWEAWLKRLLKTAFMAPIFMFFMYFIFLLIKEGNPFGNIVKENGSAVNTLLLVVIPALVILTLLLKATKFAKEGSGKLGEVLTKVGGQVAGLTGGLVLGAATGGTAMLASNTAGRLGRNLANNDELKAKAAAGDRGAQRKLSMYNSLAKSSYDVRQTGIGKFAAKKTGMDFSQGLGVLGLGADQLKGGRRERDKEVAKKLDETRKTYMLSESAAQKQNERAGQYKADKEAVEKLNGPLNETQEAAFKVMYEKGGRIGMGLNKDVEAGSVKNSDDINKDRQKAFALSLENPTSRIEDGKAIKKGFKEFKSSFESGMMGMATTPSGLALAAATAGLAIPLGGLVYAIKDLVKAQTQAHPLFAQHEEIVAAVRKGVKPDIEQALHHLQEAVGGGHGHEEKGDHKKEEHKAEHKEEPANQTTPSPNTPDPAHPTIH